MSDGAAGTRNIGVAVPIPEPFSRQLQVERVRLGDPAATGIPPHITLLPPTALRDNDLPKAEEHLSAIASEEEPFEVHLRGSGTFRPVSPVVFVPLALGISDCERVQKKVRSGPLDRDLAFPYHPHVTVAHDVAEDLLDIAYHELVWYDARFVVPGFTMFEQTPDLVWRPQRDFLFGRPLPGPTP